VSDQHRRFQQRLIASRHAMFVFAEWQHKLGYSVEVPRLRVAPTAAEHADYSDDGDVFVIVRQRFEVKGLDVTFSGRHDWPFGNRIFVDTVRKVDRAQGEVIAYVSVSADFRALAIIPGDTSQHWYPVKVRNSLTGNIDDTYACPIEHCLFEQLKER
jgi:hypothetical protein